MAHKVVITGFDTSKIQKLTAKESEQMMLALKAGDNEIREKFIVANMRLVLSVVQRFQYVKVDSDDLFQVGMVGLIKSVNNFDTSIGVKFSTYAVPMIIGEIRRFLRDRSAMKVGRNIRDIAYRAMQAREKISEIKANDPSFMEIAEEIDMPVSEVVAALDAISEPMSLYETVYNDGEDSLMLMEQISDSKNTEERMIENMSLNDSIRALPDKEKKILYLRYFCGKTQIEISEELSVSQAQVSRLEKSALQRLRKQL